MSRGNYDSYKDLLNSKDLIKRDTLRDENHRYLKRLEVEKELRVERKIKIIKNLIITLIILFVVCLGLKHL